jgi:hypothetical protein
MYSVLMGQFYYRAFFEYRYYKNTSAMDGIRIAVEYIHDKFLLMYLITENVLKISLSVRKDLQT